MAEGRIACRLAARNFCKWAGNPRFAFVLGFLAVTVVSSVLPIRAFLRDTGVPMAPWLFPFWCTDLYKQATMLLCAAFLLCDAPFLDESAPYVIVRAGRGVWAAGQLLYILLAAAVFVLYLAALTVLPFLDRLEWTQSWGKAIGTLALTDAAGAYGPVDHVLSERALRLHAARGHGAEPAVQLDDGQPAGAGHVRAEPVRGALGRGHRLLRARDVQLFHQQFPQPAAVPVLPGLAVEHRLFQRQRQHAAVRRRRAGRACWRCCWRRRCCPCAGRTCPHGGRFRKE